jgi:FAD:protein FMN transferase
VLFVLVLLGGSAGCTSRGTLQRFEFTRICMGVQAHLVVFGKNSEQASDAAASTFHVLADLDTHLSDYRVDSELNRLSDGAGGPPRRVSEDLFFVLSSAVEVARGSGGAFDPTVGPCVQLWRQSRKQGVLPPPSQLVEARALVGWRHVQLDERSRTVRLTLPGMRLDFGGIAKGYAAQKAVEHLKKHGLNRCLVALAGDIVAGDAPPGEAGWRVAVEACAGGTPVGSLWLTNAAVSTSGGCEQFVEIGGVRYAHILDPRTGLGSQVVRTVSVVARRGELADALSTAAFLRGPEGSVELLGAFPGSAAVFTGSGPGEMTALVVGDSRVLRWEQSPSDLAKP